MALGYLLGFDWLGDLAARLLGRRASERPVALAARSSVIHLSGISYEFYLLHHVAVYSVLGAASTALAGETIGAGTIAVLFFAVLLVAYGLSLACHAVEERLGGAML